MKYMLLIYLDEHALSESERKECYAESTELADELHSSGQYLSANPLQPTAMATSVRVWVRRTAVASRAPSMCMCSRRLTICYRHPDVKVPILAIRFEQLGRSF
jgi:hypothetical protein